jgi:hypothetical protein
LQPYFFPKCFHTFPMLLFSILLSHYFFLRLFSLITKVIFDGPNLSTTSYTSSLFIWFNFEV